jgi:uncharacterized RDD family membrane protein YckC
LQAPPPAFPSPPGGAFPPPPAGPPAPWQPPAAPPAYAYAPPAELQIPYAGFWIRVVAYVIDSVLITVGWFVVIFLFAILAVITNPNAVNDSQSTSVNIASNVVDFLISFAYFAGLWTLNEGTYGQRWLGLRIRDANTFEPIRPGQAALRYLGLVLSFLPLCLGVIWIAFDSRKQGWMDKLAGTVVVHAR